MLRSGTGPTGTPDTTGDQPSLGNLVELALKDVSQLLNYEIALAKKEFKVDLRRALVGVGAVGFILLVAYPILILVLFAGVAALYFHGAPGGAWAAFLYVAAALTILALIVGLIGFVIAKKITGLKLTRKTVADDIGLIKQAKNSVSSGGSTSSGEVPRGGQATVTTGETAEIPAAAAASAGS
jgi:hypothetical protein